MLLTCLKAKDGASAALLAIFQLFTLTASASPLQWQTRCGESLSLMQSCIERKQEIVLDGVRGWRHSFLMADGQRFVWFYPNGTRQCLYASATKLKAPSRGWTSVTVKCDSSDGTIKMSLENGDQVFVFEHTSPSVRGR